MRGSSKQFWTPSAAAPAGGGSRKSSVASFVAFLCVDGRRVSTVRRPRGSRCVKKGNPLHHQGRGANEHLNSEPCWCSATHPPPTHPVVHAMKHIVMSVWTLAGGTMLCTKSWPLCG